MTWKEAATGIALSGLLFGVVLRVTGEFHLSSNAFGFFAIYWLVQSVGMLLQVWRHSRSVTSVGTSATEDIPPAG
jgi:hypothetical protein